MKNKLGPLASYFGLAFAISWITWTPGIVICQAGGGEITSIAGLFILLGAFGPSAAALIVTGWMEGRVGIVRLLMRLFDWRQPVGWWLIAVFLPAFLLLSSLGLWTLRGGVMLAFIPARALALLLPTLAFVFPFGPLAEELGWRGFALPRLQERFSPLVASLILGTFWTLWHVPVFWAPGVALSPGPVDLSRVGLYWLSTMSTAALMTWIFNHTRGSVLVMIIFHMMINATPQILMPAFTGFEQASFAQVNQIQLLLKWALVLVIFGGQSAAKWSQRAHQQQARV